MTPNVSGRRAAWAFKPIALIKGALHPACTAFPAPQLSSAATINDRCIVRNAAAVCADGDRPPHCWYHFPFPFSIPRCGHVAASTVHCCSPPVPVGSSASLFCVPTEFFLKFFPALRIQRSVVKQMFKHSKPITDHHRLRHLLHTLPRPNQVDAALVCHARQLRRASSSRRETRSRHFPYFPNNAGNECANGCRSDNRY